MKNFVLAATVLFSLTACLKFPETTEELKTLPMVKSETYTVARSPWSVMNTLASKGKECLTYSSDTQMISMTMHARFKDSFRTRTESRAGTKSFIVEHYSPNNLGDPGWYPRILVDVVPASGGSQVTIYSPYGDGAHAKPIRSWTEGDLEPCPRKDLF